MISLLFAAVLSVVTAVAPFQNETQREEIDLSSLEWNITLDKDAMWEDDELFLPPVDVSSLPVNPPSGGWELLDSPSVCGVNLPATVEEYLWGWNGETFGVTGDYVGVSWFETSVNVPLSWTGRRIALSFEAVRFRAEVFVNHRLAGYDLVNGTPFSFDVSDYLEYGKENKISVRITDPNGNFNWKDSQVYSWGEYLTNPSHGFGGITGKVKLICTERSYISDVFVANTPDPRSIDVAVLFSAEKAGEYPVNLFVYDASDGKEVYSRVSSCRFVAGENSIKFSIKVPKAKLWSVEEANLYYLKVCMGEDDCMRRFGFRWFEVKDVGEDRQFYLNGKRMVLRTSISWSYWPYNGMTPSDSLARKQIASAKALGLNMLNFHRAVGQSNVLDAADEMGLLYWEEPGGNQYPANRFENDDKQSRFYFAYRNEKLRRMIIRDRSHPSLIIYNMHNERGAYPKEQDYKQMTMGHNLDPSRILVYNSSNGNNPEDRPDARFKTHLMPYDTTFYDYGWWDNHHAGGPGVYHDALYKSKDDYLRRSDHKDEIVIWGEEGAIGTPPRLSLIRDEILSSGKTSSWEAQSYLDWYDAYDKFLSEKGFRDAFPTVDSLTKAMGNVAYYYQGRIIENIRLNNIVDGYAINGWESMKLENHSGVVDVFRNLKGDPDLIARYNRPLVLSVKLNSKVLPVGGKTTADVFIINEENLHGKFDLSINCISEKGEITGSYTRKVKVSGGVVYGECLTDGIDFVASEEGKSRIVARISKNGKTICEGSDELFAVALSADGISSDGSVADTTGRIASYLSSIGISPKKYTNGTPEGKYLLVGAFEPQQWGSGKSDILNYVYKGGTLIIVDNPERWAEFLSDKEVLDYRGSKTLGTAWYGGNFFNRAHPLWEGLPSCCVFNYEYQCFATYNRRRIGLRCNNGEIVAAAVADHKSEVYSVLSIINAGRGRIILTTLDIPACIGDVSSYDKEPDADGMFEAMNTFELKAGNGANAVGRRLLLNMLKFSNQ